AVPKSKGSSSSSSRSSRSSSTNHASLYRSGLRALRTWISPLWKPRSGNLIPIPSPTPQNLLQVSRRCCTALATQQNWYLLSFNCSYKKAN
uniref:Uncharacterized protein n=1 Tax=Serinus canaria TaxID=9135 RepID=A0A8C9MI67_SERCA